MGKVIVESYSVLIDENKISLEEIPERWRDAVLEHLESRASEEEK